jgi:hypothetical protein
VVAAAPLAVEPQVFIEQAPAVTEPVGGAWYYCIDPPGYFPHVARCSRPWVVVNPSDVQRPQ